MANVVSSEEAPATPPATPLFTAVDWLSVPVSDNPSGTDTPNQSQRLDAENQAAARLDAENQVAARLDAENQVAAAQRAYDDACAAVSAATNTIDREVAVIRCTHALAILTTAKNLLTGGAGCTVTGSISAAVVMVSSSSKNTASEVSIQQQAAIAEKRASQNERSCQGPFGPFAEGYRFATATPTPATAKPVEAKTPTTAKPAEANTPIKVDPVKVKATKEKLNVAIKEGKVVDVQHAAVDVARAENGGRDDDKTWRDAREIQQTASAKRLVKDVDATAVGEAVGRNALAKLNKSFISQYLETFNSDAGNAKLIKRLDHDGDGKVSIDEFERAMYSVDISYAKMASLDHDDGLWSLVANREVSENEFMKAAKYIASAKELVDDFGKAQMIDAKGSTLFDEHKRGRLAIDDIRRTLERHGHKWAGVDVNHDGSVSETELATVMLRVEVEVHMKGKSKTEIDEVFKLMQSKGITFDQIDGDGFDGVVKQLNLPPVEKPTPKTMPVGFSPQQ